MGVRNSKHIETTRALVVYGQRSRDTLIHRSAMRGQIILPKVQDGRKWIGGHCLHNTARSWDNYAFKVPNSVICRIQISLHRWCRKVGWATIGRDSERFLKKIVVLKWREIIWPSVASKWELVRIQLTDRYDGLRNAEVETALYGKRRLSSLGTSFWWVNQIRISRCGVDRCRSRDVRVEVVKYIFIYRDEGS